MLRNCIIAITVKQCVTFHGVCHESYKFAVSTGDKTGLSGDSKSKLVYI